MIVRFYPDSPNLPALAAASCVHSPTSFYSTWSSPSSAVGNNAWLVGRVARSSDLDCILLIIAPFHAFIAGLEVLFVSGKSSPGPLLHDQHHSKYRHPSLSYRRELASRNRSSPPVSFKVLRSLTQLFVVTGLQRIRSPSARDLMSSF